MEFPLTFWDISLWLAATATILLITMELTSPRYGRANLYIERRRLQTITFIVSLLFLLTIAIRIYGIISVS